MKSIISFASVKREKKGVAMLQQGRCSTITYESKTRALLSLLHAHRPLPTHPLTVYSPRKNCFHDITRRENDSLTLHSFLFFLYLFLIVVLALSWILYPCRKVRAIAQVCVPIMRTFSCDILKTKNVSEPMTF